MSLSKETSNPKIFYGWFVVAACFVVTMTLGETFWSFGVFFKPLEAEFGWSRTVVSSGFTAFLLGYAISVVSTGRLADRYSPRPILIAAALAAGLGIALCSQVQSINQLRLFLFITGIGAGATWTIPNSSVQRWFYKKRGAGLALGIVLAGVGMGAMVFAPLINYLILSYGWRNAYLIIGILYFIIIGASALVIKRSPVEISAVLVGDEDVPRKVSVQSWTTSKVATPAFIGVTFAICVGTLALQSLSVHIVPHATDTGISPTASAAALGLMGGFSVPGRIVSGLISDRIGWQKMMAFASFGMALSILWLIFLKDTWMLYCFAFFYGICHGIRVPTHIGILGEFYGMRSLGEVIGITSAITVFLGAFSPYMAGFIFDTTGSYLIAFLVMIVLLLSGGIIAMMIKKPLIALE
ncbi:MFS transporter [Chloroflexota bacterium]